MININTTRKNKKSFEKNLENDDQEDKKYPQEIRQFTKCFLEKRS